MKVRKVIKIPVNKHSSDTPHYIDDEDSCEIFLKSAQRNLEQGYEANVPEDRRKYWGESSWLRDQQSKLRRYDFDWIEPSEFTDTYEIIGHYRGRSAAGLELKSTSTGGTCCMMIKDLTNMLMVAKIEDAKVTGRWIFKKRGQNYGIVFMGKIDVTVD